MDGQVYVFPSMVQPSIMIPPTFEKKQYDFQLDFQQKNDSNSDSEIDSTSNKFQTVIQKNIQQKQLKQTADSDYEPEKNELIIFYKKKNTESNLSNQIYSFLSSSKSNQVMLRVFKGNQEKVEDFYKLIKKIKKTNKKYMNRNYLSQLILMREGGTNFKIFKRSKSILQIEEIRKALRISFRYFMLQVCDCGLMTSKKMNKGTLFEHFARKREIAFFISKEMLGNSEQ